MHMNSMVDNKGIYQGFVTAQLRKHFAWNDPGFVLLLQVPFLSQLTECGEIRSS